MDRAYLQSFLDEDPSLPTPDRTMWLEPDGDYEQESDQMCLPSLEELMADPSVQVVLEAAEGMRPVRS